MCERISWKELPDGTLLYLTTYDLFDTVQGKKLREQYTNPDDWWGHSAIAFFYTGRTGIDKGKDCECTDFRAPSHFPPQIAQDIKDGKFRDVVEECLLTKPAWAEYEKVEQPARAEYEKVEQAARAEYEKVEQAARAEYEKVKQAARAEYEKVEQAARAEYKKVKQAARAEYEKVEQAARAEYKKVEQPAWAEYEKVKQAARAEYEKVEQAARAEYEKVEQAARAEYEKVEQAKFWKIFSNPKNRARAWR